MKIFSDAALAALNQGAVVAGAMLIACDPPVKVWSGYGTIAIGDDVFQGIGDRGLVQASGGALGGAAEQVTVTLSGVEPGLLGLVDAASLRNVPAVLWRLVFDALGHTLLDAKVFARGRLDQVITNEVVGGDATISAMIEGAAKGLGRFRGRLRSDADQKLNSPADDGFKAVSYAGQKILYWGGAIPSTATGATYSSAVAAGGYLDKFTG